MKKLLIILLSGIMVLSLASCNLDSVLSEVGDDVEQQEQQNENITNEEETSTEQDDCAPKIEESKTYTIYKEIWTGPYTMEYEKYVYDFQNPDNQTVGSSIFVVTDGENIYKEISSYSNGEISSTNRQLYMDGYGYALYDEHKYIVREKSKKKQNPTSLVSDEEAFYQDVNGDPETVTIFGKEYYGEHFAGYGKSITYCYDGDTLKYILEKSGGITYTIKLISLEAGADSSYFEIPGDYEKSWE